MSWTHARFSANTILRRAVAGVALCAMGCVSEPEPRPELTVKALDAIDRELEQQGEGHWSFQVEPGGLAFQLETGAAPVDGDACSVLRAIVQRAGLATPWRAEVRRGGRVVERCS